MGLLEFNKLPINTLVGADWKTFKDITAVVTSVLPTKQVSADKSCLPPAVHFGSSAGQTL